jgi:uncharacterized protein
MIAVDTNILVYAHREDSSFHIRADEELTRLAESGQAWAIPWSCLHEFIAIVTHPSIFKPPTPLEDALKQIDCWTACPSLSLIGELSDYWVSLKKVLEKTKICGPQVHDARIATICQQHNVKALMSADRDFSRYSFIKVFNPMIKL